MQFTGKNIVDREDILVNLLIDLELFIKNKEHVHATLDLIEVRSRFS